MPRSSAPPGSSLAGEPLVVARGLTRRFGHKLALSPTDLEVEAGTIAGLLGPNGSGKSTLLRCLIGVVRADAGEARIDGALLRGDGAALRTRCTYAPGELALYGELSGEQQLAWLLRGREREARARARSIASSLGLPLEKRVRTYSHGMKRQLLFAAALAPRLRVRILDEITEGLDPHKRGEVLDLLRADARGGSAILLSSHHLGEVDRACDRLIFMSEGRKLSEESSAEVERRARRLVRVAFEPGAPLAEIARRAVAELGLEAVAESGELRLRLAEEDPRAALARLFARPDLPRPRAIRYGEISLAELYRDLYGVEAC